MASSLVLHFFRDEVMLEAQLQEDEGMVYLSLEVEKDGEKY